jgi:hypothetical protein
MRSINEIKQRMLDYPKEYNTLRWVLTASDEDKTIIKKGAEKVFGK